MLNDLPIKTKLVLVLIIPSLVAGVLIFNYTDMNGAVVTKQQEVKEVVRVSGLLTNVAHNFAVERGLSAGFIGSKGTKGGDKVAAQREKADAAASALLASKQDLELLAINPRSTELINELTGMLDQRLEIRKGIDELRPNNPFFSFYSDINRLSLLLVEQQATRIPNPALSADFNALIQLLWLKERAGQSRGALNGVFSAGDYNDARARAVTQYVNQQNDRIGRFQQYASPQLVSRFSNTVISDPSSTQVANLRKIFLDNVKLRQLGDRLALDVSLGAVNSQIKKQLVALSDEISGLTTSGDAPELVASIESIRTDVAMPAGLKNQVLMQLNELTKLPAVDASEWFGFATTRIVNTNKVVTSISQGVTEKADAALIQAQSSYYTALIISVIALAGAIALGTYIAFLLTRNLNKIQSTLSDVRETFDFSKRVDLRAKDEIGRTGQDLDQMLRTLQATFGDISNMSSALSQGRLSEATLTKNYHGDLKVLTADLNHAVEQLQTSVSEIGDSMEAGRAGDFSRLVTADLAGDFEQLKTNINGTLETTQTALLSTLNTLDNLAEGKLVEVDAAQYPGLFGELISRGNQTIETLRLVIEQDIQTLISDAQQGQLSARIDLTGKQGCFTELSQGINAIMEVNEHVLSELDSVFDHLSRGDLNRPVEGAFEGGFAQIKANANHTIDRLRSVIESEIESVVINSSEGDLSKRIATDDKEGFFLNLSEKINSLLQINEEFLLDVEHVVSGWSKGELATQMQGEYEGSFDSMKQSMNRSVDQLSNVIDVEVQSVINALRQGDLSQRIEIADKQGGYAELGNGINEIVEIVERVILDVSSVLDGLVNGDLNVRIDSDYTGSFAILEDNANDSMSKLGGIMNRVADMTDTVTTGVSEIAAANEDLRRRTESQASSIEETASSVFELNDLSVKTRGSILETEELMRKIQTNAKNTESIGQAAQESMQAISEASAKIEDIISVINDIAFQTNLLALNAAVEAARAGEDGRGFSVVAGEVRKLAQRSAESASDIRNLISDSVEKVEHGSAQVARSNQSMREIVESIFEANDKMSDIASANDTQTRGFAQISDAVSNMESLIQQNAAMVEQVTSSAGSLEEKSGLLKQEVKFFQA